MRRQRKSLWASPVAAMLISVILGGICLTAGAAAAGFLIFFVLKDIGLTRAFTGAALAAGAYIGAYVYGKYRRRKGLFCGTLCGFIMYILISAAGMAVFGEPAGIKKLLLLTAFGAAGGVAGVNSKRPKKLWDQ